VRPPAQAERPASATPPVPAEAEPRGSARGQAGQGRAAERGDAASAKREAASARREAASERRRPASDQRAGEQGRKP